MSVSRVTIAPRLTFWSSSVEDREEEEEEEEEEESDRRTEWTECFFSRASRKNKKNTREAGKNDRSEATRAVDAREAERRTGFALVRLLALVEGVREHVERCEEAAGGDRASARREGGDVSRLPNEPTLSVRG